MKFGEIRPYARYVRKMKIDENSRFDTVVPADARIFYLLSGCGKISVKGEKIILQPGDLLYINSGVSYRIFSGKAEYAAVNFDFTSERKNICRPVAPMPISKAKPEMIIENVCFSDEAVFNEYTVIKNCGTIEKDFLRLISEFEGKAVHFELKTSAMLTEILAKISDMSRQGDSRGASDTDEIVKYIRENYGDAGISNRSIADRFGFHPNYLNAIFKKAMGCTLHAYLAKTRISASAALLECGAYSVAEVSELCGFSDANYFSKAFGKIMGCSPTEFGAPKNRRR